MIYIDKDFDKQFEHAAPNIDETTREFMSELVYEVADRVISELQNCVQWDAQLTVVSGIPYDGFFPYTDGGCEVVITAPMSCAYDAPYLPEKIYAIVERERNEHDEAWCKDYGVPSIDDLYDDNSPYAHLREEFDEYCDSWQQEDESCYFYKVRATQKNGVVTLLVMLNTDFDYGRDDLTSAGLPHVDPNSNVTEVKFRVEDIPSLNPEKQAEELMPLIIETLGE